MLPSSFSPSKLSPRRSPVGAFLLPWIEYGTGGLLLLGLETRWAGLAATCLMHGFAAVILAA